MKTAREILIKLGKELLTDAKEAIQCGINIAPAVITVSNDKIDTFIIPENPQLYGIIIANIAKEFNPKAIALISEVWFYIIPIKGIDIERQDHIIGRRGVIFAGITRSLEKVFLLLRVEKADDGGYIFSDIEEMNTDNSAEFDTSFLRDVEEMWKIEFKLN